MPIAKKVESVHRLFRYVTAILAVALAPGSLGGTCRAQSPPPRPNIVYILADDMGLGDVRAYTNLDGGAPHNAPVDTVNIDRIANAGMRFTNAHSPSAVCSPTRYALLTGQYAWRGALPAQVVSPYGRSIIAPQRLTVAEMLQQNGYNTAAFGKWHLGLNWVTTNGGTPVQNGSNVDHSQPFTGGPTENGFDTFFGIDGNANYPPYAFIRDNRTIGIPQGQVKGHPVATVNLPGPVAPGFNILDIMPEVTNEATSYIRAQATGPDPFFVYMPLSAPHEPLAPRTDIVPDTGLGRYGNFLALVDWSVGRVLDALEDPNGDGNPSDSVMDNTIVVFATDNGAELSSSFPISAGYINGQIMRGDKATVYEGGHRVPFIVRWNGRIAPGSTSEQFVELTDFMGTVADIIDHRLPDNAAEDSRSIAPVLLGETTGPIRTAGVQHSSAGAFVMRQFDELGNEWKLIFTADNGSPGGSAGLPPGSPIADFSRLQLYNLTADPREQSNLLNGGGTAAMQAIALRMQASLQSIIGSGRSAPSLATGDYNGDRIVDGDDYSLWKSTYGSTSDFSADGNGDGRVDAGDYVLWRNNRQLGFLCVKVSCGTPTKETGDYNGDRIVNAADYALWKATYGSRSSIAADGNDDGRIDAGDYVVWRNGVRLYGYLDGVPGVPGAQGGGGLVAGSIPEPATVVQVALALACCELVYRRKRLIQRRMGS